MVLRFIKILLAVLFVLPLAAQGQTSSYERNARKAENFFAAREWLNATAMYTLMLHEDPRQSDVYAHALASTKRSASSRQQACSCGSGR